MKRWLPPTIVAVLLMVCLSCLIGPVAFTPLLLAFGWIFFLWRTLPQTTVEPAAIGVAIVSLFLFTLLLHWLATWLHGQRETQTAASPGNWRWRWSVSITGIVFLLSAAGIALTVSVHQTGWLFRSDQPLIELPSYEAIHRVHSRNNLKQVGTACHMYERESGEYPRGGIFDQYGTAMHSWETQLLPYLDQPLSPDLSLPWNAPQNTECFQTELAVLQNPFYREAESDERGYALSHYAANSRVLGGNRGIRGEEITDGTSNTILAGEVNTGFRAWGDPVNWRDPARGFNRSPDSFGGSEGSGGMQFLMCDGSVEWVQNDIDPNVLKALATPRGGEDENVYPDH